MGIYFGTDGLRGIYGEEISSQIAFNCGNSLSRLCEKKKIIIGRDTRTSGPTLLHSFVSGMLCGGVDVIDVDIATTPAIAFLTKHLKLDYGIVISASHNPSIFNGIKIFNSKGYKISEEIENQIERKMLQQYTKSSNNLGNYTYNPKLIDIYIDKLKYRYKDPTKLKIVIDCANGASFNIAKRTFNSLNKNVIFINANNDGKNINNNCGAISPNELLDNVKKNKADIGFAFDGDADRIIVSDENGNILDGDDILYLISCYGNNKIDKIVGTTMTNKGLEQSLLKKGIKLIRADVGDKYVVENMIKNNALLGGETSGHIILHKFATTGDGLLTALEICSIVQKYKQKISKLINYKKYPQININIPVKDKFRILNSEKLSKEVLHIQEIFKDDGRVLVRASGTEPKIRIMCEHIKKNIASKYSKSLKSLVLTLNEKI